jgi:hypothetical protein
MNAAQRKVALVLADARPVKSDYETAVRDSPACPASMKKTAKIWAGWAAYDAWMVVVSKFAWEFSSADKDFNYEAFMNLAGYND